MEQRQLKPFHLALILVGVNLVWRLIWLIMSRGAYTDGILQITAFQHGLTFWPPFYTVLSYLFAWIPGIGLEGSARIISLIAGSLAVIPIEATTRRLFGARAAFFAILTYTVSPIPLRWSVQVMTDATFMALWMSCLASLLIGTHHLWPDLFEQAKDKPKPNARACANWLLLASLFGALATLTRYQGAALLPVVVVVVFRVMRSKTESESKPMVPVVLTLLPWILLPVWFFVSMLAKASLESHISQIQERMGPTIGQTMLNYWYMFEQFILVSPYFVTYGIFGFFLYGLFRIKFSTTRILASIVTAGYLSLAILLVQSVFSAYQSRYILPLVPFILIICGHGMSVWEKHCKDKPMRFFILLVPTLAYAVCFSSLVAFYQGNPFKDLKDAGKWIKANAPAEAKIYTTESYNKDIGAAKLEFWSGHGKISPFLSQDIKEGDFIVLSSFYGALGTQGGGAGLEEYRSLRGLLDVTNAARYSKARKDAIAQYPAKAVATFRNVTYPLLPDIMEEPLTHTNPLAWYLRYRKQYFETTVLQVISFEEAEKLAQDTKNAAESDLLDKVLPGDAAKEKPAEAEKANEPKQ